MLLLSQPAGARPIVYSGCFNDTDCGGAQCGGDVCNWNIPLANPLDPNKPYTCNPAGTAPKGMDGWCTSDENCKCRELGAKCAGVYCTFTQPSDAPQGASGSSSAPQPPDPMVPTEPTPEPIEPTTEPAEPVPVGRDDTTSRTSTACAVAAAGSDGNGPFLALILGWGAVFVGRRRRSRFIPQ